MGTKRNLILGSILIGLFLAVGGLMIYNAFSGDDETVVYNAIYKTDNMTGIQFKAIAYQGEELVDHRDIITDEYCHAENLFMEVEITPCVAPTFDNKIEQDVKFKWNGGSTQNVNWYFIYEGDLEAGQIYLGQNRSQTGTRTVLTESYVNNYLVQGVTGFTDLGTPTTEICDRGTENNTFAYAVDQGNTTTNYCFSQQTNLGEGNYYLDGYAITPSQEQYNYYDIDYDIPLQVEYLGKNLLNYNFSYYRVMNTQFSPNQEYFTRWEYTPTTRDGKWHIL
jgi:hypothetical protein